MYVGRINSIRKCQTRINTNIIVFKSKGIHVVNLLYKWETTLREMYQMFSLKSVFLSFKLVKRGCVHLESKLHFKRHQKQLKRNLTKQKKERKRI